MLLMFDKKCEDVNVAKHATLQCKTKEGSGENSEITGHAHVHDSTCYRQWLAGLRGKRNEIGKILGIALFDYGKSEK